MSEGQDLLNCPRDQDVIKSGRMAGRQRYQCQACHYDYTVEHRSDTRTAAPRKLVLTPVPGGALVLYRAPTGF